MKGSRIYLLSLLVFLVIVFLVEYLSPHQFVWKQTYDKYDKEPFGSYVFDDVLSSSIDNYSVVNKTFYQLYQEDSTLTSLAFLLTEQSIRFGETDIDYLYKLIHLGNKVMICTDNFPYTLRETLFFNVSYLKYTSFLDKNRINNNVRDSIFFGTNRLHPERIFEVFPQLHPVSLIIEKKGETEETEKDADTWDAGNAWEEWVKSETGEAEQTVEAKELEETEDMMHTVNCDSLEILVWDNEKKPLVLRAFIGKGELFIVATPLMFTNFGILDGANAAYVFRLLSYLNDRPLMRIEAYGDHNEQPQTPLRYVLSETPLRWAIYSILIMLLLFMSFTVKRRQRIIPVIQTTPNRTLGFMLLISNLYFQKHDNLEILKMKYLYFCTEVKETIGVELYERVPDESDYERLVEKTGVEKEIIHLLLHNIRLALYSEEANERQLQQYIDGMNELLRALM